MKKWMIAVALVGLSSGAAQAQGATQTVNLTANVDSYCNIGGGSSGTARSGIVSTSNQRVAAGPVTITGTQGTVACSKNATIQLTSGSGGLFNTATPASVDFTNKIHYSATAGYNGQSITMDTSVATTATSLATTLGATTSAVLDLTVNVKATDAGKRLVAGAYSDVLTVTITPTP